MVPQAFEISDVPTVAASELETLVEVLVSCGHARAVFKGHDTSIRKDVEAAFWAEFRGSTAEGVAVLIRFWSLIDVLSARRLARVVLEQGFAVLKPLARSVAKLRLNANWGFAPQRVLWALRDERDGHDVEAPMAVKRVRVASIPPFASGAGAALRLGNGSPTQTFVSAAL